MIATQYVPGDWLAVVRDGNVAFLPAGTAPEALAQVWANAASGSDLTGQLQVLLSAGIAALPPFALLSVEAGHVHAIMRGGVEVDVETAAGTRTIGVSDVSTWIEENVADVSTVTIRRPGHTVSATVEPLPVISAVVRASAMRMDLRARAGVTAGAHEGAQTGVSEAAPVPMVVVPIVAVPIVLVPIAADAPAALELISVPAPPELARADVVPAMPTAVVEPEPEPELELEPEPEPALVPELELEPVLELEPELEPELDPLGDLEHTVLKAAAVGRSPLQLVPANAPPAREVAHLPVLLPPSASHSLLIPPRLGEGGPVSLVSSTPSQWSSPAAPTPTPSSALPTSATAPTPPAEPTLSTDLPLGPEDHDGLTTLSADVDAIRRQLPPWAGDLVPAPQAPVAPVPSARLVLSSGLVLSLSRPVLIGRAPAVSRVANSEIPRLVTVASPNQDISRTHAEVRQDGDDVLVTDLMSTNGVLLLRPGAKPLRLHPGEPTLVEPGVVVDLGEGISFTTDHGSPDRGFPVRGA